MAYNNTKDKSDSQWVENSGSNIKHSPGNVVVNSIADDKAPPTLQELLKCWRPFLWCFFMYMLSLNLGYESSNLGHLLGVREFMHKFGYRTSAGTWVVSTTDQQLLTVAGFIGLGSAAIATGILSDLLGRRKTILLGCVLCFGGIFLQFFSQSIMMLFGGKILSGLGYGLGHSIGPVFVAEIAPVRFRGVCLSIINVTITLGQWCNALAIYFCQNLSSGMAWRIPVVTQVLFPTVLLFIGIPFLPESPSWLVFKGKIDEAAKSLCLFNGNDYDTDKAIAILQTALEEAKQSEETKASG